MEENNLPFITECPRDAQQGLPYVIDPGKRAAYINQLMHAGFDVIDFGSFVSPKAVPQMAGSDKVLAQIDRTNSNTKLLAIVGNLRGASDAANQEQVDIIGFPYSISETFLQKNINSGTTDALHLVEGIKSVCAASNKKLRVYISMAFGNPYGDEWNESILQQSLWQLQNLEVEEVMLSDTTGLATPESITSIFEKLIKDLYIQCGVHLHSLPHESLKKIDAAWKAGCRRFDSVMNGLGGCPMTGYELLGNVNTLDILHYFKENNIPNNLKEDVIADLAISYSDFENL
ncbi:MAG: hydroxymethylglutaryl-CoA lyase [Niabella sp.]